MKKGTAHVTHKAVTQGSSVKVQVGKHFNSVLVHHAMTGQTTGGYVSLKMSDSDNGTFIAHHGKGTNIKSANSATGYTCIFEAVSDWVEVTLNYADGTHTVTVIPINV